MSCSGNGAAFFLKGEGETGRRGEGETGRRGEGEIGRKEIFRIFECLVALNKIL